MKGENQMMPKVRRQERIQHSLVDLALGNLTPEESLKLIGMLEEDPRKSHEFELVLRILKTADTVQQIEESRAIARRRGKEFVREGLSVFAVPIRSAAAVVLVLGGLFISGEVPGHSHASMIKVRVEDMDVRTRGERNEIADIAYALIMEGEVEGAKDLLDWSINCYPEGEAGAHAHLLRGGLFLMTSERSTFGFFSHFDTVRVREALCELGLAARQTSDRRIRECALWLSVKGNVMIGDQSSALSQLEEVELMGGVHQADVHKMREIIGR